MPITTHCTCGQSIDGRCHSSIDECEQLFLTNVDNHYKMEEKNYPGSEYQPLFDYLTKEHGLTLLDSEMNDLINLVHKFHPAGMGWVKCWERKPDTHKVRFKDKHGNEFIGNYSVETGQYWAYGLGQAINDVIYWRPQDESGAPAADIEWDSKRMIGRVRDRFDELEEKGHEWRSFYIGWLEGRADMLQQIKRWGKYKTPAAAREEDSKAQFDALQKWLSEGGYSFDGEYYYDDENNFFTPDQIWDLFQPHP